MQDTKNFKEKFISVLKIPEVQWTDPDWSLNTDGNARDDAYLQIRSMINRIPENITHADLTTKVNGILENIAVMQSRLLSHDTAFSKGLVAPAELTALESFLKAHGIDASSKIAALKPVSETVSKADASAELIWRNYVAQLSPDEQKMIKDILQPAPETNVQPKPLAEQLVRGKSNTSVPMLP